MPQWLAVVLCIAGLVVHLLVDEFGQHDGRSRVSKDRPECRGPFAESGTTLYLELAPQQAEGPQQNGSQQKAR